MSRILTCQQIPSSQLQERTWWGELFHGRWSTILGVLSRMAHICRPATFPNSSSGALSASPCHHTVDKVRSGWAWPFEGWEHRSPSCCAFWECSVPCRGAVSCTLSLSLYLQRRVPSHGPNPRHAQSAAFRLVHWPPPR